MFAVNNGQVTYNGRPVEEMSEEERRRAYGSAGDIGSGAQTFDFSTGGGFSRNLDPKYWESYTINRGDSDTATGYRLRPEYERMQGMMQVGVPRSVGGSGEAIDPAGITYDKEFGYVTPITNVQQPQDSLLQRAIPYLLAAGVGGTIGMTGGFSGLLGGAGSSGTGLGTYGGMTTGLDGAALGAEGLGAGTNLGTYGGMTTGLDGLAEASLTAGGGADGISAAAQALNQGAGAPWYSQLMQQISADPLTAARAGMGLANIVDALRSRNSGSGIGADGLLNSGSANVTPFNPTGLLSGYRPMQFDPVPFMSGRYGG